MIPRVASFSFKKNLGTVSSVGLTVFSGLTASGGPVTGSGTLAISTSLSGLLKGTGSGFTAAVAGTDYLAPSAIGVSVQGYSLQLGLISALSTTSFGRVLLTLEDGVALRGAMGPELTVTAAESMTLTEAHHGATVTNYGATGFVSYTLDAAAGTELLIVNEAGQGIQMPPSSVDFLIDGSAGSLNLSSSTFGDYIRLRRTNQYWVVLENRGFSASA